MSFHFIHQRDVMQCGAACLAMICRAYGAAYSLDFIDSLCRATREGVSMLALSETAEGLGLRNATVSITAGKLAAAPLPCILHWNQNHFVVLYRVSRKGRRFHIADPGKGLLKCSAEEMRQAWSSPNEKGEEKGVAMFFHPGEEFKQLKEEGVDKGKSLAFLSGYVKASRKYLAHILLGLVLGCVLQLIMPFMTQSIVDLGINHGDISLIWLILLGELMIVVGRTVSDFIRRRLLLHISTRINISLISDFFIKLLKLPMSFFDTKMLGDFLQRIGDHSRIQNFLTSQLLNLFFTIISFAVFGVVLFVYDKLIFGVFIAGSLVYSLWISLFLKQRKIIDYNLFEQQSVNQNKTYQFLTSAQEIKLQNCERRRRHEWEDSQADLFAVQLKSLSLQQTQEAGSIFINEVKNIVITVCAATAVIKGEMSLGAMLAVQYIIGQLNSPVEQLLGFVYSMQDVKISLERINDIHRKEDEDTGKGLTEFASSDKAIELKDVSFKYDPHALKNVLEGVTFSIPQGKVTAIIGASGSGKSTLIKLLLGYYKPTAGSVSLAGRDISDYDMKWWRQQCGVVMQEGVVFSESIARNIAVADADIDRDRLEAAARLACIHDSVMNMPLKYETKIGRDGVGLSLGQKQRILIARAVYRNPNFLFFDEATNSLDASNERSIVESLERFYDKRTVIIVAHRLSTVKNADCIVVLDRGRIAEIGTHAELSAMKGVYYNLVKNQLELGS